jgi:putative chitinase
MNRVEAIRLQHSLGVAEDGVIGRGTLTALFVRCGAKPDRAHSLAVGAAVHWPAFGILDTPLRLAHHMAQLMHESGRFKYMEEIASGAAYEGREDLGNTHPGDGRRFKGRGPLQVTGRANYRRIGFEIGIDLENNPEIAAIPSIGIHTACVFWRNMKLNAYADADDILAVSNGVNRGNPRSTKPPNGYVDRQQQLRFIKVLLA